MNHRFRYEPDNGFSQVLREVSERNAPEIFIKEELSLNNSIQQQCLGSGTLPDLLQERSCKNQLTKMIVGCYTCPGNAVAHQNPGQILFSAAEENVFMWFCCTGVISLTPEVM